MTHSRSRLRRTVGGLALAGSLVLASLALVSLASERSAPSVSEAQALPQIPADLSALRVVVDPESVELRTPSAGEAAAFDAAFAAEIAAKAGPAEVYTLPNGALGARLGVAGINAAVVTVDTNGQPVVSCLEHDDKHPSHAVGEEVR